MVRGVKKARVVVSQETDVVQKSPAVETKRSSRVDDVPTQSENASPPLDIVVTLHTAVFWF